MKIAVVNGPNLNLLSKRETDIYGKYSLDEINNMLLDKARVMGVELDFFFSNTEGEIVSYIQTLFDWDGLIINAAAYTHTSIAIRDAIKAVKIPFVEVHISNIFARENFRHTSYLSDIALAVVSGCGAYGYLYALDYLVRVLKQV
ncbi:type II 3-dehydroquinate dehydratase [Hippea jasoniae]|uniref:type II 3-dehydroquinate dehydratase n=1 Tax=Hippea jasoniae TaxID=944479 RepID=UPI0005598AEF|nr:type II 3-dehydroquinate dehydratase [Hippea jasoniae]